MITQARLRASIAVFTAVAGLFLAAPLYAKSDPQKAPSKDTMPVSAGSALQPAALITEAPEVKISKAKDGIRTYGDGRIAQVRDGSSLAVYVYQDEANSYTVYRSDSKDKTSSTDLYVNGVLRSSLDQNGNYTVYYDDGKVKQRIVREGLNVFSYDYSYHSTYEIDAEGTWNPVVVLEAVNVYLSTDSGFKPYSTTTYTKADLQWDTPTVETTTYFMDPVTETSGSGKKKQQTVNFKKLQRNVLKSVKNPFEDRQVKTNDKNTYTLKNGTLKSVHYNSDGLTYYFVDGMLVSVYDGATLVIKLTDQGLVRV